MKLKLKVIITIVLVMAFAFFGYKIFSIIQHKKQVAVAIQNMPSFVYQTTNGATFTNANLKPNVPTLFFYYNSECDFCNHEAQMVQENITKFTNCQLVFVSFEKTEKIKAFATQYKLENYDNVTFVADTKLGFATTFDVKSLPAIVIYNKNNKLVQRLKGQTKPEKILELLNLN